MRGVAATAVLLTGCVREDATPAPAPRPAVLALSPVGGADADCRFSAEVDGPALLVVSHRRDRAEGMAVVDGQPVALTGTIAMEPAALPTGVQLKGDGLTVAVQPADLPGVPVGVGGVRRAAVLTAATSEGTAATVDGEWSCRAPG